MTHMKFFEGCKTIPELKTAYRKLVMIHHPDRGGNAETMKAINAEYERAFRLIQSDTGEQDDHDINDGFREIINKIASIMGVTVEICGCWIWVTGDTKPAKELLKEAGFRWSNNKKAWYWHPAGYRKRSKKKFTLDEIRQMHGSTKVNAGNTRYEMRAV